MSTMEEKYNNKSAAVKIKILVASKAALEDSDRDTYAKVLHKNKASTGVLQARKQQGKKNPKPKGYKRYYVL